MPLQAVLLILGSVPRWPSRTVTPLGELLKEEKTEITLPARQFNGKLVRRPTRSTTATVTIISATSTMPRVMTNTPSNYTPSCTWTAFPIILTGPNWEIMTVGRTFVKTETTMQVNGRNYRRLKERNRLTPALNTEPNNGTNV